ncbi:MAG: RluA family pseudouridine synthase [Bacteroidales bacterium]|nr:RluA family pseudouridine synthase [Bacteroidales bacterium]
MIVHWMGSETDLSDLPERFTYPYCYEPHRLIREIAKEVTAKYHEILEKQGSGKMMGAMIVRDEQGKTGYLLAFSGEMPEAEGCVPPIVDYLSPEGYFKTKEREITAINRKIDEIETSAEMATAKREKEESEAEGKRQTEEMKALMKKHKEEREERRKGELTEEETEAMTRESQHEKAELKRLQNRIKEQNEKAAERVEKIGREAERLREERRRESNGLQEWLFAQYRLLNAQGITKRLDTIFEEETRSLPPSGAGDCCAPRLLQYAYSNGLKPVTMGEFWVGPSPDNTLRREGTFYPACQRKCKPILTHQLKGLNVEENPLAKTTTDMELPTAYEDQWLMVVNKPGKLQSVPGLLTEDSVTVRLQEKYGYGKETEPAHRLDQMTSGLLIVAKSKEILAAMHRQFERHEVKKKYVALLTKKPVHNSGTIELPIGYDMDDSVRRAVDKTNGKEAITRYRVMGEMMGKILVEFTPETGRTHQLRIHSAHKDGLDSPIVGDGLYGTRGEKMYLCSYSIQFMHPVTGENIKIVLEQKDWFL